MHVALTGISGFLGSNIAHALQQAGHTVTGLVRANSRRAHIENVTRNFVVGDHADEAVWPELLDGADCVIHNSVNWEPLRSTKPDLEAHFASNLNPSIKLIHAANPRQFIFISTIAVHHDMSTRWAGKVDEDHPLRPRHLYGAFKAAVEAHLWSNHFTYQQNTSALRPCGVYGIDPNPERSYGIGILRRVRAGRKPLHQPGGGKFIHVEDVARAVANAVGNDAVAGRPFNLADCYARWGDIALLAAEVLGKNPDTLAIDLSSPPQPRNNFSKNAVREILHVELNRGHAGLKEYLEKLAETVF